MKLLKVFEAILGLNTFCADGDLTTFQNTMIVTEDEFESEVFISLR